LGNLNKSGDLERYHIVIVDDGSTDGTTAAINSLYPEVKVLEGNGDLWWTGAIAKGMEYAYQQGAEYFIWLNDDCLPARDTLRGMVTFMQLNPNTLVAPSCYSENSNLRQIQHNGFRGRQGCAANPGEIIDVDGMSGWCVGIPSAVYEKIGVPDAKKFPHYSGDDIYTFQATKAGFKAYLMGDLRATLCGPVHAKLDFQDYFQPGLTPAVTFKSLFFNKKSPYLLSTRFFVFQERYGLLIGMIVFITKFSIWIIKWLNFQLKITMSSKEEKIQ
jgi:glycosyltransferase involved in cell wall biosynthesis